MRSPIREESLDSTLRLVGRDLEIEAACEHLRHRGPVVLGGPAGVGKTALLDACVESLANDGFRVTRIVGVAGGQAFAMSAVAHLLAEEMSSSNLVSESAQLAHVINRLTSHPGAGSIIAIDDLPLVDDVSLHAVLAAQSTGRVRVIASARSSAQLSDRAATLTLPPGLHLELAPLQRQASATVAAGLLGGPLGEATIERLHQAAQGLPLQLTELVRSVIAQRGFERRNGLWHWTGAAAADTRLDVLLGLRVEALTDVDLAALETLCFAEHLPFEVLELVHTGVDLAALERSRMLRSSTRLGWIVPGHPLLRDVVNSRLTPMRRQVIGRRLLAHWRAHPPADGDLQRRNVMLACELGEPVELEALLRWSRWSRQHNAGRHMVAVTERAWHECPTAESGLAHADALTQCSRLAEADLALIAAEPLARNDAERVTVALARVNLLRHGLGDIDKATEVLVDAEAATASEAERLNLAAVAANDQLLLGSFAETIRLWRSSTNAARHESLDDGLYRLTQPAIIALATGGLVDEAAYAYQVNIALRPTSGLRHPLVAVTADVWWAAASTLAGAGHLSAELIQRSWTESVRVDNSWLRPVWALPFAMTKWLDGDLAAADRLAREALGVMPGLEEVKALAGYALIRILLLRGMASEAAEIAALVADGETPAFQAHATWLQSARSQLGLLQATTDRDRAREISTMVSTAAAALELGQVVPAAFLLHDAMRLRPQLDVAAELTSLAADVDSPVVHLIAEHATCRRAKDPDGLVAVAETAESTGLRILGLAALEDAALLATGGASKAKVAEALLRLRARCTGLVDTPTISAGDALGLSPREREVAAAAARGLTDREIAATLFVSVRTVNAQMRSIYSKLGVDSRRSLRDIAALRDVDVDSG